MEENELNELHDNTDEIIEQSKEIVVKTKAIITEKDDEQEMPPEPESIGNPYYEEDPKVGGQEYVPSKFLSRGCSSCPKSYHAVDQKEIHSCAKLDDHNWMKNIRKPFNENNFDIVEVRFKNNRKEFFKLPDGLEVTEGDVVAVEGSPGHDVGIVSMTGELCRIQMKKRNIEEEAVRRLYRRAKATDIEKWVESLEQEEVVIKRTKSHISDMDLSMKLNDVEIQGDGSKAIFYYTADERVDFRSLIKILADEFKIRVEMKQIGVRQESSRLGGLGTCGRELCCATWLTNFKSVNTSVAKTQQIALNPQKLAGQCGKLKCCLNYEYEIYLDAISKFPDSSIPLKTKKGTALFVKTDIFRSLMWYSYDNERDNEMYALSADSVKEIIAMNERNELPEKIEDYKMELMSKTTEVASDMEFDMSILTDRLDRIEQSKEDRASHNRNNNHRQGGERRSNDRRHNSGENRNQNRNNSQQQGQNNNENRQNRNSQQRNPQNSERPNQNQRPNQNANPNKPQANQQQRPNRANEGEQKPRENNGGNGGGERKQSRNFRNNNNRNRNQENK